MAEKFEQLVREDPELRKLDDELSPAELYDLETDANYAFSGRAGQWLVGRMRDDAGVGSQEIVPAEQLLATSGRRAAVMGVLNMFSAHHGTVEELVDGLQVRLVAKVPRRG